MSRGTASRRKSSVRFHHLLFFNAAQTKTWRRLALLLFPTLLSGFRDWFLFLFEHNTLPYVRGINSTTAPRFQPLARVGRPGPRWSAADGRGRAGHPAVGRWRALGGPLGRLSGSLRAVGQPRTPQLPHQCQERELRGRLRLLLAIEGLRCENRPLQASRPAADPRRRPGGRRASSQDLLHRDRRPLAPGAGTGRDRFGGAADQGGLWARASAFRRGSWTADRPGG